MTTLPDHPVRRALLDLLAEADTATSTQAAQRLGLSSGLCSFHLRQLARLGLIEEAPRADARARPWRLRWEPDGPATLAPMITTGRIILLNGTSSAGKSSIARELLPLLDRQHYYMPVDSFNAMRHQREVTPDQLEDILVRLAGGYHRSLAGMALAGNDVIADHVLRRPEWLRECLDLFPPDVVFVGVHCPLPELERRERARGDRPVGKAATQFPLVHRHGEYDVEVDTSALSPRECADAVLHFIADPPPERAFDRLRRSFTRARL